MTRMMNLEKGQEGIPDHVIGKPAPHWPDTFCVLYWQRHKDITPIYQSTRHRNIKTELNIVECSDLTLI